MQLRSQTRRSGFTLMELLIVIAIIAILAALTFTATTKVIERQRRNNTVNFFQSLDKILSKQVKAVAERARKERIPPSVLQMAGGNQARARVIWVKLRLKQHFPVTLAEARNPHIGLDGNAYVNQSDLPSLYARSLGTATGGPESAICLSLALKRKRGGVSLSEDEVKPYIKRASNGLDMFADGWGNPIGFYRFPYQNTHMNSSAPVQRDPFDPEGLLLSQNWTGTPGAAAFQQLCHPLVSVYMIPTVVSAGSDEQMGFNDPGQNPGMSGITSAAAQDNIFGYLVRSGGTGRIQ